MNWIRSGGRDVISRPEKSLASPLEASWTARRARGWQEFCHIVRQSSGPWSDWAVYVHFVRGRTIIEYEYSEVIFKKALAQ